MPMDGFPKCVLFRRHPGTQAGTQAGRQTGRRIDITKIYIDRKKPSIFRNFNIPKLLEKYRARFPK